MKGSIKAKSGIGALMLPTPFAWYAADDLMLSDNDPVTVWPDRGPNGLDATLATVDSPVFKANATRSGLPAVSFTPTRVLRTNVFPEIEQPNTIFVVWNADGAGRLLDGENDGSRHIFDTSSTAVRIFAGSFLTYTRQTNFPRFLIHTGIYNGANSAIREDGQLVASGNVGAQDTTRFTIGAHHNLSSNPFNGDVAEIIVYDRLLTQTEIEDIERYLYFKYFTVSLSGQIDGISLVEADIARSVALSGSIAGSSQIEANLDYVSEIWGSIEAESDVAGLLVHKVGISGRIDGTSSVEGDLLKTIGLSGLVLGQSDINGALNLEIGLEGSIAAQSDLAGRLGLHLILSGDIQGASVLIADLLRAIHLFGRINAESNLDAVLNIVFVFSGDISCGSELQAVLRADFALAAQIEGISHVEAFIQVKGLPGVRLLGSVVKSIYLEGEVDVHG